MSTLVSFLGRGSRDGQYKPAQYQFDDGSIECEPYFVIALARRLKPESLLLVGTAGSAWDVFFGREAAGEDEAILELMAAIDEGRINDSVLETPAKLLGVRLGLRVDCLLIDEARDATAQARILMDLSSRLPSGEQVTLDVTHSFRHLPMLAMVAARYLAKVRGITVDDIYYGAFEMKLADDAPVPVVRLGGLLRMLEWVEALNGYEHSGDYAVFAPLLEAEGLSPQHSKALSLASFRERVGNSEKAKEALTETAAAISGLDGPFVALFRGQLRERLAWATGGDRGERELRLARTWLERDDYLRAAIFLLEGLVTSEAYHRLRVNFNDRAERVRAADSLAQRLPQFDKLQRIRNALAHAQRSHDSEVNALLTDEQRLRQKLETLMATLPQAAAEKQEQP